MITVWVTKTTYFVAYVTQTVIMRREHRRERQRERTTAEVSKIQWASEPESIAVILSNGGLLTVGTDEAYNEVTNVLKEWREFGEPDLAELKPCFIRTEDGWAVRPRLVRRPTTAHK